VGDMMLNAELVPQGYAQVATFPQNVQDEELFLTLQRRRGRRSGVMGAIGRWHCSDT
jgi:hypothetical protein